MIAALRARSDHITVMLHFWLGRECGSRAGSGGRGEDVPEALVPIVEAVGK